MPIFEYRCLKCNTKFEVLHKSSNTAGEVTCPNCDSMNNKKLLSTFSATTNGKTNDSNFCCGDVSACEKNQCGCGSGMFGLN